MRFHLIDRITELVPAERVRAVKLTSVSEPWWADHGRGAEFAPPLVLESLCQAGTWLVMASTDFRRRAALLSVDGVEWDAPVRPGAVLELEGVVETMNEEIAVLSGTATVDGQVVMRVDTVMCALLDADTLEDPQESRRTYRHLLGEVSA